MGSLITLRDEDCFVILPEEGFLAMTVSDEILTSSFLKEGLLRMTRSGIPHNDVEV
jgi:hypothetical protein